MLLIEIEKDYILIMLALFDATKMGRIENVGFVRKFLQLAETFTYL